MLCSFACSWRRKQARLWLAPAHNACVQHDQGLTPVQRIKYGVVAAETLRSDLRNWDTCYISGRLHKPVQMLRADAPLMRAHESNLQSALAAGILLLPPRFTRQARLSKSTTVHRPPRH